MEKFLNRVLATLASGINDVTTSLPLTTGHGARFGTIASGDKIRIVFLAADLNVSEIAYMTAISGDTATIERGQDGTTATSHIAGVRIEARIGKSTMESLIQAPQLGVLEQNSQSANYTLVAADGYGKHILHPSADTTARTITIPANSSVPFKIGTTITFVNQASAGVMTIAITTDTMRLAGAGTTGSRSLAANGVATAIKLTATEWIISGVGLT